MFHFEVPVRAGAPGVELVVDVGQGRVGRGQEVDDLLVRQEVRAVAEAKVFFWGTVNERGGRIERDIERENERGNENQKAKPDVRKTDIRGVFSAAEGVRINVLTYIGGT